MTTATDVETILKIIQEKKEEGELLELYIHTFDGKVNKTRTGKVFLVDPLCVLESKEIYDLILDEDRDEESSLSLPTYFGSKILNMVMDFCKKRAMIKCVFKQIGDEFFQDAVEFFDSTYIERKLSSASCRYLIKIFRAALELKIKSLADVMRTAIVNMVDKKPTREILKMFNLTGNITRMKAQEELKFHSWTSVKDRARPCINIRVSEFPRPQSMTMAKEVKAILETLQKKQGGERLAIFSDDGGMMEKFIVDKVCVFESEKIYSLILEKGSRKHFTCIESKILDMALDFCKKRATIKYECVVNQADEEFIQETVKYFDYTYLKRKLSSTSCCERIQILRAAYELEIKSLMDLMRTAIAEKVGKKSSYRILKRLKLTVVKKRKYHSDVGMSSRPRKTRKIGLEH